MKLNTLSLISGAIALTLSAAPYTVRAQETLSPAPSTQPSNQPSTQPSTRQPSGAPNREMGFWQQLNLTQEQKGQLQKILQETRTQFEAILTPDQLAKLKAERQSGDRTRMRNWKESLKLTDDQQARMRSLWQAQASKAESVLTPEQLAQLQKLRETHQQSHQQHHNSTKPGS